MRVDRLTLKDFTVFGGANLDLSPGLNVFIGANGTGKSHVLKVLFSMTRSMALMRPPGGADPCSEMCDRLGLPILQTLERVFRPEAGQSLLTSLIRHGADNGYVKAEGDFGAIAIDLRGPAADIDYRRFTQPGGLAVLVPAAEVLSMYPGFVAAYERRELSFDATFRDLCVDLSATPVRSVSPPALAELVAKLDAEVGGETVLRGGKFYVSFSEDWLLEAPMLAEGLRKLATIAHLIRNGSLTEKSILFWDEPETNLNPKLITVIAGILLKLANAGVQLFIATHDYLLTNELSVAAEYGTPEGRAANPKFFCFTRAQAREPVTIQSGDTVADLAANPILEEFAAHYDRGQELFAHAVPSRE